MELYEKKQKKKHFGQEKAALNSEVDLILSGLDCGILLYFRLSMVCMDFVCLYILGM